jgi:hypothetical protein
VSTLPFHTSTAIAAPALSVAIAATAQQFHERARRAMAISARRERNQEQT